MTGDIDGDCYPDWLVGAPTAGSGLIDGFPKQSGWVGWLEFEDTWTLQREWTGDLSFDYFGWSLEIMNTNNKRRAFVGTPKRSHVQEILAFEKEYNAEL